MATVLEPVSVESDFYSHLQQIEPPPLAYREMSDEQLVTACQHGNQYAFESLIKRHHRTVFGLIHHLAPDISDPADLAQEVFLRIWRHIGTLRDPRAFRTWLRRIVSNLFNDELRKRPKHLVLSIEEPLDTAAGDDYFRQFADPSAQPDELLERRQLVDTIEVAIEKLSQNAKTMFVLREVQGLSYEEIASVTRCPLGTVKSRIARARTKLQTSLSGYVAVSAQR